MQKKRKEREEKNMLTNELLFKNIHKVIIKSPDSDIQCDNANIALSVNRNIEGFGYTLSTDALATLAKLPAADIQNFHNEIINILNESSGCKDYQSVDLFYPNFPEEVMEKSEIELYLNSLLYYTFSQTPDERMRMIADAIHQEITEEKINRLPLIEYFPAKLEVINLAEKDELEKLIKNRINAPKGMSADNLNDLRAYAKAFPKTFYSILLNDEPFSSKENLVKTATVLYELGRTEEMKPLFKDAADVLRFAAHLSNKNFGSPVNQLSLSAKKTTINPSGKICFKLTAPEKRLIKELLNNCSNLYYDVWKNEGLFKRLMSRIDAKKGPERVVKAFDNLSHKNKTDESGRPILPVPRQFTQAVHSLIANPDEPSVSRLNSLVENFPGYFMKNIVHFAETASQNNQAFNILLAEVSKCNLPVQDMLTAYNSINLRVGDIPSRVFKTKSGHFMTAENKPLAMSKAQIDRLKLSIMQTLRQNISQTHSLGKTYIDPELDTIKIPTRSMRDCSAGNIIPSYSIFPGNKNKNLLTFGIYWKNPDTNHRCDIDLSASLYDANMNKSIKSHLFFRSLKCYSDSGSLLGVHSGDYTDAPNGATEMIALHKQALKEAGIKYAVIQVNGFSVPFSEAEGLKFITMEKEGTLNRSDIPANNILCKVPTADKNNELKVAFFGEPFEASQFENPIKLNAPATSEIPCIYDIEKDNVIWIDYVGAIHLNNSVVAQESQVTSWLALDYAENNAIPTMEQLFSLYAQTNGEITKDIREADTIFTRLPFDAQKAEIKDNAKIICSYELDYISDTFCGKPENNPSQDTELIRTRESIISLQPEKSKTIKKVSTDIER